MEHTRPLSVFDSPITYQGTTYANCTELAAHLGVEPEMVLKTVTANASYYGAGFRSAAIIDNGYVYRIDNTKTKMSYVGSCNDVATRMREHLSSLYRGKHANPKLQAAFIADGATAFTYSYSQCESRLAAYDAEQALLDELGGGRLYNTSCSVQANGKRFEPVVYKKGDKPASRRKQNNDPGVFLLLHKPSGKLAAYRGARIGGKISDVVRGAGHGKQEYVNIFGVTGPIPEHDLSVVEEARCKSTEVLAVLSDLHAKYRDTYEPVGKWSGLDRIAFYKVWSGETFRVHYVLTSVGLPIKPGEVWEHINVSGFPSNLAECEAQIRLSKSADPANVDHVYNPKGVVLVSLEPKVNLLAKFLVCTGEELKAQYRTLTLYNKVEVIYVGHPNDLLPKALRFWKERRVDVEYDPEDELVLQLTSLKESTTKYTSMDRSATSKRMQTSPGLLAEYERRKRKMSVDGVIYLGVADVLANTNYSERTLNRHLKNPMRPNVFYVDDDA
jgi:predicted GIY-YIG superfamily endonuclease